MNTELGKKFKEAREQQKLSFYRIAKDTGLPIHVIHRLERGGGRADSVVKLAKYLGVTLI